MTKAGMAWTATASLAILVAGSGVVFATRYGGICAVAIEQALAVCPLGFLERSLAAGELLPQLWFGVAVVVLSLVLFGRVFCAWVCPASLLRRIFRVKPKPTPSRQVVLNGWNWATISPYIVLGGVLVASILFRFPVFCFVCPVGLAFASLFAVFKLFSPDPLSAGMVLFPLMLGLELFALKSWCRSFCPLGALLSIIGSLNRFLVPVIDKDKCRTSKGIHCEACERACPEGIDLTKKRFLVPNSCTKCLECYDKCPVRAIKIAAVG